MSKTYAEKLKDPRWQRKRLEVMKQAGFKCEICWDSQSSLQIHHPVYKKGADPWDYEKGELLCCCEECHKTATASQKKFKDMAFTSPAKFVELMDMINDGILDAACECLIELMVAHSKKTGESVGVYHFNPCHTEAAMRHALKESGWFK